jgi:general secretion pathway protein F
MPVYDYKGLTPAGGPKTGIIDADSPREARIKLRAQNVLVTEIAAREASVRRAVDDSGSSKGEKRPLLSFKRRLKGRKDVPTYTRQLATLLKAGIPLASALSALIEQCQTPDLEAAFRDIREKITQGLSFAEALSYHPAYFDDLFANMVKAGEAAGNLDGVLNRLADYLQRQAQIRNKVSAALAYPIVMLVIGVVIVIILMTFVVPKIMIVVEQSKQTLPLMTRLLRSGANFFKDWWLALAGGILAIGLVHRTLMRRKEYRYLVDRTKLRIPVMGELFRKAAVSRFAVSTSTLLKSGVPVLEALTIVKDIVGNAVIARVLDTVHDRIVEGTDIATPIKKSGVFPPVVGYMIAVGEQSGQLEEMLDRVAEAYDEEVEVQTEKVTSLLEPIMIVAMAAVVGFIVLSIMQPILKISDVSTVRGR